MKKNGWMNIPCIRKMVEKDTVEAIWWFCGYYEYADVEHSAQFMSLQDVLVWWKNASRGHSNYSDYCLQIFDRAGNRIITNNSLMTKKEINEFISETGMTVIDIVNNKIYR